MFPEIIGQEAAKSKLGFFLESYYKNRIIDPIFFVAPKGCGKTFMAHALGRRLTDSSGRRKAFIEINCSILENLGHFFHSTIFPFVVGKETTVFLDEASEIPKDITMALLTILNPNNEHKNDFIFNGTAVTFDLKQTSWILATSEIQKVFPPLVDRLERIDLEEYNVNHLAAIILRDAKIDIEQDTLFDITSVLRGNPRGAQKISKKLKRYALINNKSYFSAADWERLKKILHIFPFGLSPIEIQILKILRDNGECSLTNLSAKTGLSSQSLRCDIEMYPLKLNLFEIKTKGRMLTVKGAEYLEQIKPSAHD